MNTPTIDPLATLMRNVYAEGWERAKAEKRDGMDPREVNAADVHIWNTIAAVARRELGK